MREMIGFVFGVALVGFVNIACGGTPKIEHTKYKVATVRAGVKAAEKPAAFFIQAMTVISKGDGTQVITVNYSAGSTTLFSRNFTVDPDGKAVSDDKNQAVLAPAPPSLQKAHAAYAKEVEALLSQLASSGKVAP